MADLILDDASVMEGLDSAARLGWSGVLRVLSGRRQVGAIVLRDGRIAWAVCQYQREDLGSFLQRLGCLTTEQLIEIRKKYEALGKTKKFVTLLDESGILDKETLKGYLRRHVSRAVSCLSSLAGCNISARGGGFKVDETLTFTLEEIIGSFEKAEGDDEFQLPSILPSSDAIPDQALAVLDEVPGYRCAVVGSIDGKIYAFHSQDESSVNESVLFGAPAAWLNAIHSITVDTGLGPLRASALEADRGHIIARFIRPEFGIFLAMYLDERGRVGAARHRVDQVAKTIEERIQLALQTHETRGQ